MIFEIHAERNINDQKTFFYDNVENKLWDQTGLVYEMPADQRKAYTHLAKSFDKDTPLKKSRDVSILKIQLGLSCNYSCDYCSQKFVERPKETSKKDIDNFMTLLSNLQFSEERGLKVEFWGGEPFVYWKTLKPLAEAIKEKFSHWSKPPHFSVITNGSILTEEICAWLYAMGFSVAISHDGPGQPVRGPDPFEDHKKKEIVLSLYNMLRPLNRISFNPMLSANNTSRKEIYEWFVGFLRDTQVTLGEGGIVDAYDEDGVTNSLSTLQEHFEFRRNAFNDIYSTEGNIGFTGILQKIDDFVMSVLNHKSSTVLGQKCGMDREDVMAIDMTGNVITCQNVSSVETAMNGEQHLSGNISDIDSVSISSSTHWTKRDHCKDCPVLHICKGACMFLQGKFWETSCANSYSDSIAIFALAFEKITDGYIPVFIKNEHLPKERQDIWGTVLEHKEEPKRKVIPITVINSKTVLDDIEVYTKSEVIGDQQ